MNMADTEEYPLHKAVFESDIQAVSRLLRTVDIAAKDRHGELC